MKKILAFLLIYPIFFLAIAQTQVSIPEAPKKVEFANILIELNPEALKALNAEITSLLTPQNKFLEQKLERMQWYFPIIEKILEEEDIPEDMKYIAVLESSLLPEAISSSNAVGFWQFKEATAKEVGLKVDNKQDDRKNVFLSTKAAALYLKRHNLIFKNWLSCMMAYNMGVEGASDKINPEWSFASEVKFDENTDPYLIKALAHRIAFEHRLNRLKDSPKKFVEYATKGKSLAEIAVELTIDITELRKYNPWLYAPNIPEDKPYKVLVLSRIEDVEEITNKIQKRVDANKIDVGFPQLKRITMVSTSPDDPVYYEINGKKGILAQSGEEVAQLSTKAKMKIGKFLSYNDMTDKDLTKEGSIYYLQKKSKKAATQFHTVHGEQTLWDVSQIYGVGLKYLLKYNRMKKSERLQPGRVIWLQKTRPKNEPIEVIKEAIEEEDKLPIREDYTKKEEVVFNVPPVIKEKTEVIEKPKEIIKETPKEIKTETVVDSPKTEVSKKSEIVKTEKPIVDTKSDGLKVNDDLFVPKNTSVTKPPIVTTSETKSTTKVVNTKHMVKPSETMFSIAKRYNLSVDELRKMNNMSSTATLKANQLLTIGTSTIVTKDEGIAKTPAKKPISDEPIGEEELVKPKPIVKDPVATKPQTHVVSFGETLFSISKKYDVSVSQIKEWNNITGNSINSGQSLVVSNKKTSSAVIGKESVKEAKKPASNSGSTSHTVTRGETLYSISKKYDVSVNDIKKWNNMADSEIMVGSKIIIKK
ncbi:MAG: LysM peptidoglycan-binding domain-containing protein [Leadbetterella sp.]|nr:LysM peptidoglycan-binding domain-containing protein [Leadbetterella sp.]